MTEQIQIKPSVDGLSARYDFKNERGYIEITKIFNETPPQRTILCAPTSYGCALGCTFCHLTKIGSDTNTPISYSELKEAISKISYDQTKPVLLSLMGAGEPLLNLELIQQLTKEYPVAIATSLPTSSSTLGLIEMVEKNPSVPLKIYVSIHSFVPEIRRKMMPKSTDHYIELLRMLSALPKMEDMRGHATTDDSRVIVHYTLIPGENDSKEEFTAMTSTLKTIKNPPRVKFLKWSDGDNTKISHRWMELLNREQLESSWHAPNGSDVGGACGQFNPMYYAPTQKEI